MIVRLVNSRMTLACWVGMSVFMALLHPVSAQQPPKYLIVHADDAGMSHSANQATIQGLEGGLVTSASIMVPCPWFKEFALYAKNHPQYDYGIHLTLNSEWDVYRWGPVASSDRVPSLIDEEGYLWDEVAQVAAHAKADEVRIELKAQIDKALAFGVPLSHLDTHMGALVSRPDLVEVYVEMATTYNLPILFLSNMSPELRKEYPAMAARFEYGIERLQSKKLPMLDHLIQLYGGDNLGLRKESYRKAIASIQPGITELIIHCGIENDELRAISTSSIRRDQDRQLFTDPEVKKWIEDSGAVLTTWKKLPRP
ncbi:MAG: polysaccharide deacetylase family protein [Pirellulales bacterium]